LILIAEPVHFGDTHVQVNAAFVSLFKNIFPQHQIEVVAEEKHIDAMRRIAGDKLATVNFAGFKQYSQNGPFFWFQKIWGEWQQIFKVVLKAKKEKPELLVWLCLFPTGHLLLRFLHILLIPKQKHLVVCHGELAYLSKMNKRWSEKVLALILKKALKHSPDNVHYLVLGQSIKDNLPERICTDKAKVLVFQHPFLYDSEIIKKDLSKEFKVCVFGALTKEKNVHLIYEIASRFEDEIKSGIIQFQTFGRLQPQLAIYQNSLVQSYRPETFLPHQELEEQLLEQDLALFFYDQSMYELCASGALHEALNLQLPFISFRNEYFVQMNQDWSLGVIVNNLDEMEVTLKALLEKRIQRISEFQTANIMFLQQNSFLLQSEKLKSVLKQAALV